MLSKRVIVAIILLPIGILLITLGGIVYTVIVALILGLAAWEYNRLFKLAGLEPASWILIGGVVLLVISRGGWAGFGIEFWLSLLILVAMAYHLIAFERGRDRAATDFGVTLGGLLYLGWLGSYLVALREVPDGMWWILLALPSVWLADIGALEIGRRFGQHKMSPRLSPKKSWEGYFAGVAAGAVGGAVLATLWNISVPAITAFHGLGIGLALAVLTPLGDLGESMIKRQVGVKDSSNIIPGHGGVMDRIDSWLWAGVIAYYLVVWFR